METCSDTNKPICRLEDWKYHPSNTNFDSWPFLSGRTYDHSHFVDGTHISTSIVFTFEIGRAHV